ncbi:MULTISPECIES: hypothetical protein [unclassified Streptomyces]|uniref:hypothetical protein n=1 Tax=unclassified Streptomyces TaxID=2593676 RepID=UPI0036650C6E
MRYRWCENCRGMRVFRHLATDAERAAARKATERTNVDTYIRCAHAGCVRVQSTYRHRDGGDLPEEFRIPAAASD